MALNETTRKAVHMRSKSNRMLVAFGAALALCALTAGPALAAGKPLVETKPATVVGEAWSTLNGTVNPNGATTKYYFEYGETTSYGKTTAQESAGAGTANLAESKAVTGLAASKTYHFRVVATNSNGTTDGADEVFTTKAAVTPGLPEISFGEKESFPATFQGTSGSAFWRQYNAAWECTSSSMTGSVYGPKTLAWVTIVFSGCKVEGKTCGSEGSGNAEKIVTEPLEGTLVYLSKTAKTVGIDFKAQTGTAVVRNLRCFGGQGEVRGSIVMPITSVNKLERNFLLKAQEAQGYENEKGEKKTAGLETNLLQGKGFTSLSWTSETPIETNRNVEVKA
jgi:hypothetical protein